MAGCGSRTASIDRGRVTTAAAIPQAHPQVVEPVAGAGGAVTSPARTGTGSVLPSADPRPTGPATNTKAPATSAPSDAQVRAAVTRFKQAVAQYHLNQLNFTGVLLNISTLPPGPYNVSIASFYTDFGLPTACGVHLTVTTLGVANKTLPCGTEVIFVYNGRAIRVPVIDRGPYIAGRDWDLTAATAEALHFPGLGPVTWRLG